MNKRCLYCYQLLEKGQKDYHPLCSRRFFGTEEPPELGYSLKEMADLGTAVVKRSIAVPGVQPKISMSLAKETLDGGNKGRLTVMGMLGGNFILKPPHEGYPELPQNEHLTMKIAEIFGIAVVPSSLVKLTSGELAYITKRIDRTERGEKIHMLDMFQILEAFDKYKGSMEKIGKAIAKYAENTLLDLTNFFELTIFCFLTGNNDMHLKNFSMINKRNSEWGLAPAYDLLNVAIANPEDKDELALTIDARKSKLNRDRFIRFGEGLGLSARQIQGIFNRLLRNKDQALELINISFLSKKFREDYIALLESRYDIIQDEKEVK